MGFYFWVFIFGFLFLGFGFWVLNFGFWVLGFGFGVGGQTAVHKSQASAPVDVTLRPEELDDLSDAAIRAK